MANSRILDTTAISTSLGGRVCQAILGLHALTGCDTTSAFYGRGKKQCFKRLLKDESGQQVLSELGAEFSPSEAVFKGVEVVACKLYGSAFSDINEARYAAFCANATECTLPPAKSCIEQHIRRASKQSAIWHRALQPRISATPPHDHGWKVEDERVSILWSDKPAVPTDILPLVHCRCTILDCLSSRCSCAQAGVPCTDLCGCALNCRNVPVEEKVALGGCGEDDSGNESD